MKIRMFACLALLFLGATFQAAGQVTDSIVVSGEIGLGYTIIDLPTALEWDENYFEEWDQFYGRVVATAFFFNAGPVTLGASVGWNRLYYYWVRIPWVPSPLVYEGTVAPVSVGVTGELGLTENLRLRSTANVVIFGDGVTLGVRTTAYYRFPISANLSWFAGGTADVILGSGVPVGVGIAVGVDYSLDL